MPVRSILARVLAAALAVPPLAASAQTLPGDHLIVPGIRIGPAALEQADQGALVRDLGEPDKTIQRGDHEFYVYRMTVPDAAPPPASAAGMTLPSVAAPPPPADYELMIEFDLTHDAPFEISTVSPDYRTRDGLSVGSTVAEIHAALGPPLCEAGTANGAGLIVYGAIWFSTAQGAVTRVSVRKALSPADFQSGPAHC